MEKSMTGINDLECVRMQYETGLSTRYMEDQMKKIVIISIIPLFQKQKRWEKTAEVFRY